MRRCLEMSLVVLLGGPSLRAVHAQEAATLDPATRITTQGLRSTLSTLPVVRDIASAEREGAAFPRGGAITPARAQMDSSQNTREGDARTCNPYRISPRSRSAFPVGLTRSGDFVIGGDLQLVAGLQNKVWWSPTHDPSYGGKGLLVRAARLDPAPTPADTARIEILGYGWPSSPSAGGGARAGGGGVTPGVGAFFPSGFALPSAGQWLVVATSGNDWGCFLMNVVKG